jgi:hypothetical protein
MMKGILRGAGKLFNLKGRYYFKEDSLKLQQLRFIDIFSLSPRNTFFKPVSWKVNTGFDRELFRDGTEHLVYRINPGGGFSYKNDVLGISYIMLQTDLNFSNALKQNYSLGFGGEAGFIKKMTDSWKMELSAESIFYEAGDEHHKMKASWANSFKVSTNNSILFSLSREKTFDRYQTEGELLWRMYL